MQAMHYHPNWTGSALTELLPPGIVDDVYATAHYVSVVKANKTAQAADVERVWRIDEPQGQGLLISTRGATHPVLYYFIESSWTEWKSHLRRARDKLLTLLTLLRTVKLIIELTKWLTSLLPLFRIGQSPGVQGLTVRKKY